MENLNKPPGEDPERNIIPFKGRSHFVSALPLNLSKESYDLNCQLLNSLPQKVVEHLWHTALRASSTQWLPENKTPWQINDLTLILNPKPNPRVISQNQNPYSRPNLNHTAKYNCDNLSTGKPKPTYI